MKTTFQVDMLHASRPSRRTGVEGQLQVIATIAKVARDPVLKSSGKFGVFTNSFLQTDEDRMEFKMVPLSEGTTLAAALRIGETIGNSFWGIIPTKRGFGIRVKSVEYEVAVRQLRPTDFAQFTGKRWEVTGCPRSWGRQALTEFLTGWQVVPIYTYTRGYTRTWVVQSADEPQSSTLQHSDGICRIKEAERTPWTVQREVPKVDPKATTAWVGKPAPPPAPRVSFAPVQAPVQQQPKLDMTALQIMFKELLRPMQIEIANLQHTVTIMSFGEDGEEEANAGMGVNAGA